MMLTVTPRSVDLGYKASQQLMYDNAIAVFGLVPMFAYMVNSYNQGYIEQAEYAKRTMMRFKNQPRFIERVQNNLAVLNGDKPTMVNDIKVFDLALTDLGYYEQYNQQKLESELISLVAFLNIGV